MARNDDPTTDGSQESKAADRRPYEAVEEVADALRASSMTNHVKASHDSYCTSNAAGTDEAMLTTHRVYVEVDEEDADRFEVSTRSLEERGIVIKDRESRNGDVARFTLGPRKTE